MRLHVQAAGETHVRGRHVRINPSLNSGLIVGQPANFLTAKDAAGQQLEIFTAISRRFMDILREQLSEADLSALEKRIEHDLTEVPLALIDGSGSVKA